MDVERARKSAGPGFLLWGALVLGVGVVLVATLLPLATCAWCEGMDLGSGRLCIACGSQGKYTLLWKWRHGGPPVESWDEVMAVLRAGGGFDDIARPEGMAFARVKWMGPCAYPRLIRYIDHEDPVLGRAAVRVLNELTGMEKPLPNEATKAALKAEWERWLREGR